MFPYLAALAVGLCLLGGLVLWLHVDNWRRDLTQHHALTSPTAAKELLRPLTVTGDSGSLAQAVRGAAAGLPRWRLVGESQVEGGVELRFERTSRLFRFVDDVSARIRATPTGAVLDVESRSRVGKGDLGQNPRNIQELLAAVRQQFAPWN